MVTLSTRFSENFWGEKNVGFEVLSQNLKHSLNNIKELETYFRECTAIEDQYSKSTAKLAQQSNKNLLNNLGTFNPLWQPIKELNERISALHAQKVNQLNELIRETQRYAEDLKKKIKKITDNESQTQSIVQSFNDIILKVKSSKDQYHSVALDFEKQKRAENTNLARIERKLKQNYDEYKLNIDKYNAIRNDFERKLQDSCNNFQIAEENHLKQMTVFIENYSKLLISSNQTSQDINQDFYTKIEFLTPENLIQTFIENKKTGFEKHQELNMIEPDLSKLPTPILSTTLPQASTNLFADFSSGDNQHPNNSISNTTINNSSANLIFNPPIAAPKNATTTTTGSSTSSSSSNDNMRRSDSKTTFIINNIFDINPFSTTKRKKDKTAKQKKTKDSNLSSTTPQSTHHPFHISSILNPVRETSSINSEESIDVARQPPTSASLDYLEPISNKSNLSDVDSEGYSIRPDLKEQQLKKNNDDMTTLYPSSIDSDSDSDLEEGESNLIKKIVIKPKTESETKSLETNTNVLQEIGKSLQLTKIQLPPPNNNTKSSLNKRNIGVYQSQTTTQSAQSQQETSIVTNNDQDWPTNSGMSRSISLSNSNQLVSINELAFNSQQAQKDLYNIDEDKEVESSFQTRRQSQLINQSNSTNISTSRYTPACFPGRTTPDFRHSASLFENTTRAITSPLTLHGSSVIPFAIAFNETIHAYFKLEDLTKYKLKCYGCMKISFPFAILKLLSIELPQLEFSLSNLKITDDLIINKSLIQQTEPLKFVFDSMNLIKELKEQHQKNKQAAFFNFELLKYELNYTQDPPLLLYAKWHSLQHIDEKLFEIEFCLEYTFKHNKKFTNTQFMLILNHNPNEYQLKLISSEPLVISQENDMKLQVLWQQTNLDSSGKLTAKFSINFTDSTKMIDQLDILTQQSVYVKFQIDNDTLSRVKCDVLSPNYKVSLLKEKIESGKYFCTPQPFNKNSIENESSSNNPKKRDQAAGSISTQIGSSVDILLNY